MMTKWTWRLSASGLIVLIAALFPLWSPQTGFTAAEKLPIRIAWQPAEEMRFYAAKELGLFEREGLAPEYAKFAAGPPMFAAFTAGSVDVGYMWMAPAVIGLAQGIKWKYVMIEGDGPETEGLVVRKDSGIAGLRELKGKTIAVTKGTSADFAFFRLLNKVGLREDEVKILNVVPTNVAPAFRNNDIQGAYIWEPWMTKLVNEGGRVLATDKDADLGGTGLWLAREAWLEKNPEAALRFIAALDAATQALANDRQPAVKAMVEALAITSNEAASIYERTYLPTFTEQLDPKSPFALVPGSKLARDLKEMGEFLHKRGRITAIPNTDAALEPSLLKRYVERRK